MLSSVWEGLACFLMFGKVYLGFSVWKFKPFDSVWKGVACFLWFGKVYLGFSVWEGLACYHSISLLSSVWKGLACYLEFRKV